MIDPEIKDKTIQEAMYPRLSYAMMDPRGSRHGFALNERNNYIYFLQFITVVL